MHDHFPYFYIVRTYNQMEYTSTDYAVCLSFMSKLKYTLGLMLTHSSTLKTHTHTKLKLRWNWWNVWYFLLYCDVFLLCIAFKRQMNMSLQGWREKSVISTRLSSYDISRFTLITVLNVAKSLANLKMKIHFIQIQIILYIITLWCLKALFKFKM